MNRLATGAVCLSGMAVGLWIDTRAAPLDVLAAWCGDAGSPWRATVRHWEAMPASHGLMGVAALFLPEPFARRLACAATMLLAMAAAMQLAPFLARAVGWSDARSLLVMMWAGMVAAAASLPAKCAGPSMAPTTMKTTKAMLGILRGESGDRRLDPARALPRLGASAPFLTGARHGRHRIFHVHRRGQPPCRRPPGSRCQWPAPGRL